MIIDNLNIKRQISKWLMFMFCLISLMIIVGGLTRLTDSGLSITKWQLFSGVIPPFTKSDWIMYFNLYKEIPEFQLQNYDMSLNEFKIIFWWEWAHRILGRIIGIAFLLPLIYFTIKLNFRKLLNLYFIFFLICFQGFIGWYMVSSGLVDRVDVSHFRLSIHLIIAFIILSLIYWNYLKLKMPILVNNKLSLALPLILLLLIYCQIIIGAFVSGMDAGTIYNSWPMMGNSYFPDDNKVSNLLSLTAFSDPSLVQFIHRNLAYTIILTYMIVFYKIYKNRFISMYYTINLLGILLLVQVVLGILTLLYGAQIKFASMHQISSIFLVSSCIYLLFINKNTNSQPLG
ncbi:MAG: heme A synthase [Candidatus Pelagibacter sp. TMED118]|nr:MAG: heme A synthase [Candidatus Pelagibacter sp. TMED118]|tara:strand:+ start:853 stop:1884 length:1032 start_codon:yes stop_codon:yes gene_type:complete